VQVMNNLWKLFIFSFKFLQTYLQPCVQKTPEKKLYTGLCVNHRFNPVCNTLTEPWITRSLIPNRTCSQFDRVFSTGLRATCHKPYHYSIFLFLLRFLGFSTEIMVRNNSNK